MAYFQYESYVLNFNQIGVFGTISFTKDLVDSTARSFVIVTKQMDTAYANREVAKYFLNKLTITKNIMLMLIIISSIILLESTLSWQILSISSDGFYKIQLMLDYNILTIGV